MQFRSKSDVKEASIAAVIVRADGTREPLGQIAYYHRNPLKRLIWRIKSWLPS